MQRVPRYVVCFCRLWEVISAVGKNASNREGTELRAQRARSETKKPEQQEQNAESAPNEERNEELSGKELDQVAGGGISLNFTKIEVTKADGTAEAK